MFGSFKENVKNLSRTTFNMSYRWGQRSIREQYEDHFSHDKREVTVHRVVNIVEKRNLGPRPDMEYDRGLHDHPWYGSPQHYRDTRGYYTVDGYPPNDEQYFDEKPYYGSFGRSASQQQIEGPYSHKSFGKDDLRHQLSSRKSSRGQPFRKRGGRQSYPPRDDREDFRANKSLVITRERSPVKKEAPSTPAASRNLSPDSDKSSSNQQAQQKHKSSAGTSQSSSSSIEDSPPSDPKDQTPASAAEQKQWKLRRITGRTVKLSAQW
ncbi:hypothetical protein OJAV_G00053410 [Oryzias javanicus]|uniref:Uncharacterized protein n=1 Tax=Oryzias javanicus TaxID=123683 RepID=A0A437D991_ORYJA|nr:hypothetical protein OJAV_G00053410 [Oryzias javanicus]